MIEHVVRGQWSALDREEKIKFWAERDRANSRPGAYEVGVEQEPGSGGKESAESTALWPLSFCNSPPCADIRDPWPNQARDKRLCQHGQHSPTAVMKTPIKCELLHKL